MHPVFAARSGTGIPIWFVNDATWPALRQAFDAPARAFADASGYEPKAGQCLLLPGSSGLSGVLFGLEASGNPQDPFLPGKLPGLLPPGTYRFGNSPSDGRLAALAFALGSYRFTRYRKQDPKDVQLELPDGVDGADLSRIVEAVTLARDLVNTPANDLGPAELESAARTLADRHGASLRTIVGEALLAENFPLIHAVGRASSQAPRLIDLTWGDAATPKVTIVGKGVTFDTGGLDIKPESAMLIMKKAITSGKHQGSPRNMGLS